MSIEVKPGTIIKYGDVTAHELLAKGFTQTLCFAIDGVTEQQIESLQKGCCALHLNREQIEHLKEVLSLI